MPTERYAESIEELAKKIKENNPDIDLFAERKKGRVPTQAFSDFLTHKEQGDWAEDLMLEILNGHLIEYPSVSYGRKDDLIAGDKGFSKFYEMYQQELDEIGKCPDILIFDKDNIKSEEISLIKSEVARKEIVDIVSKARAALEVRSSAFLVEKYEKFVKSKKATKDGKRKFLSFTPKIEDLSVILKWIQIHNVPHYYVQVLFDQIYVISFKKILKLLTEKAAYKNKYFIEKNSKNQFKSTIHINLNEGDCICKKVTLPKHLSEMKKLPRGRLLFYVKFATGELPMQIDKKILQDAFSL